LRGFKSVLNTMSKFEQYNILLKDLPIGTTTKEFILDDAFFQKIDGPEVQKGSAKATVTIRRKEHIFELLFKLAGTISVPCDRCLDDMEQEIAHEENLLVKFGNKFSEEDEIVIVSEVEGSINIAWFLYEFIVLNIPIKHVHRPGKCNKMMISKLKKHIAYSEGDDDDEDTLFDLNDELEETDTND